MPTHHRTRRAEVGEHEPVASCVHAAYSKYVGRIGKKPAPMLADYAALIRRGMVYVLADDGIVGVLVMEPAGDAMLVENVAVNPLRQGSGLGRELMRFAEASALKSSMREVRLYTNEKMTENIAFYKKLGYREAERRLDDGYRRVFMRKKLS